jgi:hypothetical protein
MAAHERDVWLGDFSLVLSKNHFRSAPAAAATTTTSQRKASGFDPLNTSYRGSRRTAWRDIGQRRAVSFDR